MKLLSKLFDGELGHLLMCYQGHLRWLSDIYSIDVVCRTGHSILYRDFAHKIIEFDPESENTSGFECIGAKKFDYSQLGEYDAFIDGNFDIGYNYNHETGEIKLKSYSQFYNQAFIKYGQSYPELGYDLLIHARSTNKWGTLDRNWSIGKWKSLVFSLPEMKIGCVGTVKSAYHITGDDLRGIELSKLVNIMASSKLIVGPSSGPMHLASLCGLQHLVWSPEFNRLRYEQYWNPLGTKVYFYGKEGWQPKVESIYSLVKEFS